MSFSENQPYSPLRTLADRELPTEIDQEKLAVIQQRFETFIAAHPQTDVVALERAFKDLQPTPFEHRLIRRLYYEVISARVETRIMLRQIKTKAIALLQAEQKRVTPTAVNHRAAKVLFEKLTNKPNIGKVRLIEKDTTVGLYFKNLADYRAVTRNPSDTSSGTYQRIFLPEKWRGKDRYVNFIAISSMAEPKTQLHEEAHVYHEIIRKTLEGLHPQLISTIWGGGHVDPEEYFFFPYEYQGYISKLIAQLANQEIDITGFTQGLDKIITACLPEALETSKDEIIVDFQATNTFDWLQAVKINFANINNSYEFFDQIFDKPEINDSPHAPEILPVIKKFYENYNDLLEAQGGYAKAVWSALEAANLPERKAELVAILRQNPLDTWREKLRTSLLVQPIKDQVEITYQQDQAAYHYEKRFYQAINTLWELDSDINDLDSHIFDLEINLEIDTTDSTTQLENQVAEWEAEISDMRTRLWEFLDFYNDLDFELPPAFTPAQKATAVTLAEDLTTKVAELKMELKRLVA